MQYESRSAIVFIQKGFAPSFRSVVYTGHDWLITNMYNAIYLLNGSHWPHSTGAANQGPRSQQGGGQVNITADAHSAYSAGA